MCVCVFSYVCDFCLCVFLCVRFFFVFVFVCVLCVCDCVVCVYGVCACVRVFVRVSVYLCGWVVAGIRCFLVRVCACT